MTGYGVQSSIPPKLGHRGHNGGIFLTGNTYQGGGVGYHSSPGIISYGNAEYGDVYHTSPGAHGGEKIILVLFTLF